MALHHANQSRDNIQCLHSKARASQRPNLDALSTAGTFFCRWPEVPLAERLGMRWSFWRVAASSSSSTQETRTVGEGAPAEHAEHAELPVGASAGKVGSRTGLRLPCPGFESIQGEDLDGPAKTKPRDFVYLPTDKGPHNLSSLCTTSPRRSLIYPNLNRGANGRLGVLCSRNLVQHKHTWTLSSSR